MQGGVLGFGGVDASESRSDSEDIVWDAAGECLDLELARRLNVVDVIGIVWTVDDQTSGSKAMDIAHMGRNIGKMLEV